MRQHSSPASADNQRPVGSKLGTSTTTDIRFLSYNILLGQRWPLVRELIQQHPADVICLQEVPEERHYRSDYVRPSQIVRELGLSYELMMLWRRSPRSLGNMTLVRGGTIDPGYALKVRGSMPYGCVHDVVIDGARITVANIHMTPLPLVPILTFLPTEALRWREARDLTRRFVTHPAPVVALGDFNSFYPAPAAAAMRRHWLDCRLAIGDQPTTMRPAPTRPTYGLPFVIDFIFARGPIDVLDYTVVDTAGSDHRAVLATLRVPRDGIG